MILNTKEMEDYIKNYTNIDISDEDMLVLQYKILEEVKKLVQDGYEYFFDSVDIETGMDNDMDPVNVMMSLSVYRKNWHPGDYFNPASEDIKLYVTIIEIRYITRDGDDMRVNNSTIEMENYIERELSTY